MLYNITIADILTSIDKLGILKNRSKVPQKYFSQSKKEKGLELLVRGEITVEEKSFNIEVGFSNYFPISKPMYFLEKWNSLGFLPHVDSEGEICYVHEEGLVMDSNNLEGIINLTMLN